MTLEDQHTGRKSLRTITGKTAGWDALAKDCVCFANGAGGRVLIGIEDGEALPPAIQRLNSTNDSGAMVRIVQLKAEPRPKAMLAAERCQRADCARAWPLMHRRGAGKGPVQIPRRR